MLSLNAGFLHPIIHLGFGVEFQQPAIVAEALAQAAVHGNWMGSLLLGAEDAAKKNHVKSSKALVDLLDEIHADEIIRNAPKWDDGNKLRDGIVKRVPEAMIKYASQYVVTPDDDLEYKVAEMTNATSMFLHSPIQSPLPPSPHPLSPSLHPSHPTHQLTRQPVYYAAAAQHPPHSIKFDFFFIHCVNSSIFFSAFLHQPWLSTASKTRLLEWKARNDLAMYASRGSPALLLDEIHNYHPKVPSSDSCDPWGGIFERVGRHQDDGHAAKLVRAVAHGQAICGKWENKGSREFRVRGDMWLKVGHMAIDSVESGDPTWVRSCGFEEAWEKIKKRDGGKL